MGPADFDDFAAQFCAMLDLRPPTLVPGEGGERAFTITYREAEIGFIERKGRLQESMSMLLKLGAPPPEREAQVLRVLMGASFLMMADGAAAFVRDPVNGEIFLHRRYQLAHLDVRRLRMLLDELSELPRRWSRDPLLRDNDTRSLRGEFAKHEFA